jgi:hypothetical protein
MTASRRALIGVAASVALLGTVAVGYAQSPTQQGRVIQVPPGAVVLVLPAGAAQAPAFDTSFPFADMPSPIAMMRQMDQMMAEMQRGFAAMPAFPGAMDAALPGVPQSGGRVAGVVVTSFSNGHGTCTQRITYNGDGTAPVVQVASTGDACASAGVAPTVPAVQKPAHTAPHLIEVQNRARPAAAPLTYAQAGE